MKSMFLAICLLAVATCANAKPQTYNVKSADEFEALVESGKLAAGDTIVWADGINKDVELDIEGVDGTAVEPITLRAANPGGVVLRGETQFKIGAQWWVIQGFHFDGIEGENNNYNTFQFRSNSGKPSQHVRLTDCAFTNLKTDDETSKWLLLFGQSNVIDHCHFSGKQSKGALLTVELGYLEPDATAGHIIAHNYFGNVTPSEGSDNETIRIGASEDQNKSASCIISDNYFFGCNGEAEIISSKASFNVFERNTFRQCAGSLVLRHGHHARVEGNFFFGDGVEGTGGIRVVDSYHTISNNYLQDLTGTKFHAALCILGGKAPSGGTSNGYQAVEDITVMHNSIINCTQSINLCKAKGSRGPSGVIASNLISSTHAPLITEEISAAKLEWISNLFYGAPIGIEIEAITPDPILKETAGLLRPDPTGPAADAAIQNDVKVVTDIDGQTRPDSALDIGCDEVSGAIGEATSAPPKPADVGVSFFRGKSLQEN